MSGRFEEALALVRNEFEGLDSHRQYRNAFARLLKPDPLGRVLMMGTDQRDLFVPALRDVIAAVVPPGGHILDLGAGDGQTFALIADAVPAGTTVSFEEPNAGYARDYAAMLAARKHLRTGAALVAGFEDLDAARLPADGSIDLVLAVQMLFFLDDLPTGLTRMARLLKPGGALAVVVADESVGFTGQALEAFIAAGGDTGDNQRHRAAIAERRDLLSGDGFSGPRLPLVLAQALPDVRFALETVRQPSRLYGHTLSDLIALSIITILARSEGTLKFKAACDLLRDTPHAVDLRIEHDGVRKGMFSVTQPQFVSILRRLPD